MMYKKEQLNIIVKDLCEYALDREDVKWITDTVPESAGLDPDKLEYELQLLKIVTVGWSISYYLQDNPVREKVVEPFWHSIHEVSGSLSQATSLFIGKNIDYFKIIKSRLDNYVLAMSGAKGDNPASAIGPEFAKHFGDPDDLFSFMAGSKMFRAALGGVRQYLQTAGLITA